MSLALKFSFCLLITKYSYGFPDYLFHLLFTISLQFSPWQSVSSYTIVVINSYWTPRITNFGSYYLVFGKCGVTPHRLYRDSLTLTGSKIIKVVVL